MLLGIKLPVDIVERLIDLIFLRLKLFTCILPGKFFLLKFFNQITLLE